jgi:hypothetical protein
MCYIDFIYDPFFGSCNFLFFPLLRLPKTKEESFFATITPNFKFKLNKLSKPFQNMTQFFLKDVIEFWSVCYDIIMIFLQYYWTQKNHIICVVVSYFLWW